MAEDTYESQYLALCQRFPGLRTRNSANGWLPRPAPERLGALVDLCHQQGHDVVLSPGFATVIDHEGDQDGEGPEAWQALTAALTACLLGKAEEAA